MKRWPLQTAYFWERAPFFRLLLPLAAGIVVYYSGLAAYMSVFSVLVAAVLPLTAYCIIVIVSRKIAAPAVLHFSLLQLTLVGVGLSLSYFTDIKNDRHWFAREQHETTVMRILDEPVEKEKTWKLSVSAIRTIRDGTAHDATGNAFVYVYKDMPMLLHKGDTVLLRARWEAIRNTGNPYEFDYAKYCRHNNIYYQQICSAKDIRMLAATDPDKAPILEKTHNWCMAQLDRYIPGKKAKGLLQAMLLGDEVNLDEDLRQSYTATGIVHIIAISGGNVAIFFVFISTLLFWLKHKKHEWIKFMIALPLVWAYVIMAGAAPSAIRAAIMFSLLAIGIALQKQNNSLNQLFAAAFVLLCAQPAWLYSIGFQLSFIAVLSLIIFYPSFYRLLPNGNIIVKKIWAGLCASLAAEILIAPLVIYYFHTFPVLFLVANVQAMLFMSIVLILSISVLALAWLPPVASFIGNITNYITDFFNHLIFKLQHYNPTSFYFLRLDTTTLFLIYFVIGSVSIFLFKKQKNALYAGFVGLCSFVGVQCVFEWHRIRQEHLVVYNVPGYSHAEVIKGSKYYIMCGSDVCNQKITNAVTPTHTMLGAWEYGSLLTQGLYKVRGRSVLIIDSAANTTSAANVDYLVLIHGGNIDPVKLQEAFHPKMIILASGVFGKERDRLAAICNEYQINMHIVSDSGAFVL